MLVAVAGPFGTGRVAEGHAGGTDVVAEHPAELVVAHPADIGGTAAERRHRRDGVGAGAARDLARRPETAVQEGAALLVDQGHGTAGEPELGDQIVLGVGQDVDDRVADAQDVVAFGGGTCQMHAALTSLP